ncbi:MAG: hypothetical protein NT136_00425 [Candidatus Moranbacteria bacterium]|nr:hypothetical protein [Candidatus Moranbacteria bacterium]
MKKINYLEILKKSWKITWSNRYLWWFGFFLALGKGGVNFNLPLNWNNQESKKEEEFIRVFNDFMAGYWEWLLAGLLFMIVLMLVIVVLKIISRAGLIKGAAEIEKGKAFSFKEGFLQGKKYFWKIFLTGFLIAFFLIGIIITLFSPVAFLIYLKSYILAVILGFLAVLLIIALAILVSFIKEYAYIYLVLSNLSVRSSLENAYQLFRRNIWPSVIMMLIFIPIGLAIGIAAMLLLLTLVLVFLIIGLAAYLILAKIGVILTVILGSLVFLALVLLLQSIFETFRQVAWVLFFKEIASVKVEEEVTEKETVKTAEKVLDAGEA